MALTSPGVQVTVIDQSQYLPGATSSVPLVVFATAQDKTNPNGTGIAAGTTAANAGKLFEVTSQRDLTTIYGTPKFYTTTDGTPIQGYELNEYGLLAAYSALNVSNRCYCLRADIDLASLVASTGRPTGAPEDGAYWLDTTSSTWGIYEWDADLQSFVQQFPIVITDETSVLAGVPLASIGNIGDYAVVSMENYDAPSASSGSNATYFYKNPDNTWVPVGSPSWVGSFPAITGTNSNPSLTAGNTFDITLQGYGAIELSTATIQVPGGGNNNVLGVAGEINSLHWAGVSAAVNDAQQLVIYITQNVDASGLIITTGTGTVLDDLGIAANTVDTPVYYNPVCFFGTAAQMPLWGEGQAEPRPSGSVWIKVGAAGAGFVPVFKRYNATTGAWVTKTVGLYTGDATALYNLDATGGQAIPEGTVYGQYDFYGANPNTPVYFWERVATGETVVTGVTTAPDFSSGPYAMSVYVTLPNSSGWSSEYVVTLADNSDATDFVTAWSGAGIPYTTATVTTDGAIQLTHTLGGSIRMSDIDTSTGLSNGLLAEAGFIVGTTDGAKLGYYVSSTFSSVTPASSNQTARLTITSDGVQYHVVNVNVAGTGYAIGDTVTIDGADLGGASSTNDFVLVVTGIDGSGGITQATPKESTGYPAPAFEVMLSNFVQFTYTANEGAPTEIPDSYTNWFYAVTDQVDILVNTSAGWKSYGLVDYNINGFPLPTGTNETDPNGPIISASEPTLQSDNTALVYGDLWVDTSDLENYPVIYRYQQVSGKDTWVLIDNTDQTSGTGILFADARWSSDQDTINPANDPIPTIKSLLTSTGSLDLDAPASANYPVGMLLWNTRRSGNNVKQWRNDYFTAANFPDQSSYPTITSTWVSASGLKLDGSPYMGRQAQRNMIVESLKSVIDTNTAIRDEDNNFNLICTPNYVEVQQNMVLLNIARGETGYILGDTPMRLSDDATELQAWANTQAAAGGPFRNTYLGLFYPSGLANDLSGNQVAVPPSHMMLFTFLRNDQVAYPWFAAAGTRRGLIENANGIGYIDSTTGEFQLIKTRIGVRDVLYTNFINPLVYFTGNGLLNYGNKTSYNSSSALDRTNVARLVAYIRRQLTIAARPFVFEPNDALTRQQIAGVIESLMVDLVAKRGIYDYLVVCDESNNTPARIDRNELWVDVAIEPVKAAEFIYIPVRVLNTGELSGA